MSSKIQTRTLGKTGIEICPLVIGGHGLLGGFKDRPEQTIDQAIETLKLLVDAGMTHFDYTFATERGAYAQLIEAAGLTGKLKPIIWYMDQQKNEERPENSAQDFVDNVKYHLDELGIERAGAVIKWDNRWPKDWPAHTLDAIDQLKAEGLTESVGIGVLAGARANEKYFIDTWEHWDFIAPYWSYTLRRSQMLVEFARERGLGVYSVGAFLRGVVFDWPGVKGDEQRFVRAWLRWILREPSAFGFALSMQSKTEAQQVIDALAGDVKMTWEDISYFYEANLPIQPVDYRFDATGESAAKPMEVVPKDEQKQFAEGTNMLSGSLVRWAE